MIIIRVKLIYMVWDVVSMSKSPFCSLPPRTCTELSLTCALASPCGSVLSEPGGLLPRPGPHPKRSFNSTCQNALCAVLSSSSAS
nr:MAG TPA: hypothetical protein [Caudoviricetes sp.]